MSTRLLSNSSNLAWVDGKAYKVLDPTGTLSSRPSPSWTRENFRHGTLWPTSVEELLHLVNTDFPGLTLQPHIKGDSYRQGATYLVVERRDAFKDTLLPHVYDCLDHGYARTSKDFFFGFKFRDGGKWFRMSTIMNQPLEIHNAVVPPDWIPRLIQEWGFRGDTSNESLKR